MTSKPASISVNDSFGATLDFPLGTPESMRAVPALPVAAPELNFVALAGAARRESRAAKTDRMIRIFAATTFSALVAMILFICLR